MRIPDRAPKRVRDVCPESVERVRDQRGTCPGWCPSSIPDTSPSRREGVSGNVALMTRKAAAIHVCGWDRLDGTWTCAADYRGGAGCGATWDPATRKTKHLAAAVPRTAVVCHTCGRTPTGRYPDGSPRYDHGHGPDGLTWVDPIRRVSTRTCPACGLGHPVLTTCAGGWRPGRIETSRRREVLTWSHHQEVAADPPEVADAWLDQAEAIADIAVLSHELAGGETTR